MFGFCTTYRSRQTSIRQVWPPAEAAATRCRGEPTGLRQAPHLHDCVKQSQFGSPAGTRGTMPQNKPNLGELAGRRNTQNSTILLFPHSSPVLSCETNPIWLVGCRRGGRNAQNEPNFAAQPGGTGPAGRRTRGKCAKRTQFPAAPGGTGPQGRGTRGERAKRSQFPPPRWPGGNRAEQSQFAPLRPPRQPIFPGFRPPARTNVRNKANSAAAAGRASTWWNVRNEANFRPGPTRWI